MLEAKMSWCSLRAQRLLALLIGSLALALCGSDFLAAVLANDLKLQYNLGQSSVEVFVGLGSAAANLGYPWGLVLERVSPRTGFLISMVLGTTGGLLLFTADYALEFYHANWWLLTLYWTAVCSAFILVYLLAVAVCLGNFPIHRHGLIMGTMLGAFWCGQALLNWLYVCLEPSGRPHKVGYIFLLVALANFVFKSLAAMFVKPLPIEEDAEMTSLVSKVDEAPVVKVESQKLNDRHVQRREWMEMFGLNRLWELDFHLLTWGFVLSVSVGVMYIDNVSIIGASVKMGNLDEVLLIGSMFVGMFVTLTFGFFSDLTLRCFPRTTYVICGAILQGSMLAIFSQYGEHTSVFILTTVVIFGNNGVFFSMVGTIVHERFGLAHFKRDWGLIVMVTAGVTIIMTTLFAELYDAAIVIPGSTQCNGLKCLQKVIIIGSVLTFCSAVLFTIFIRRETRRPSLEN